MNKNIKDTIILLAALLLTALGAAGIYYGPKIISQGTGTLDAHPQGTPGHPAM